MSLPTTRAKVIDSVFRKYKKLRPWDKLVIKSKVKTAYSDARVNIYKNSNIPDLPVVAIGWSDEKERLGRDLTRDELIDILGWAV